MTKEPAPFYADFSYYGGGYNYAYTIPADRGFEVVGGANDDLDRDWVRGHMNGHNNGWVRQAHIRC